MWDWEKDQKLASLGDSSTQNNDQEKFNDQYIIGWSYRYRFRKLIYRIHICSSELFITEFWNYKKKKKKKKQ